MELYAHNQEAYTAAVNSFRYFNRACIIRPTGTGKSVIIAKFISDNRNKRHLLLAPGAHIFIEIQKHTENAIIYFSTYTGLKPSSPLFRQNAFDFIYLDEFHRLGAAVWGQAVLELLKLNPKAKVLGTSATPIRYLDDCRDMSKELFGGNVVSEMSLNRAIVTRVLPAPKYVSALYSVRDEVQRVRNKVESLKNGKRMDVLDSLNSKIIDWEKSYGLERVLGKHLDKFRPRIIVFCRDWEHLKLAEQLLKPIFRGIYGRPEHLRIYAKRKPEENRSALDRFRSDESRAIILYTIDMVNEGLHSKNCNTVILLRETTSPNLFYQQIGRAFSVKADQQPLIIDLVNNFKNLLINKFKDDIEIEESIVAKEKDVVSKPFRKTAIQFFDETREIREIFEAFEKKLDDWSFFFNRARQYYCHHGHLFLSESDIELYNWLNYQRKRYRAGALGGDKVKQLRDIGMDFDNGIPAFWMSMYFELKRWFDDHDDEPVFSEHPKLSSWLLRQRESFSKGQLQARQFNLICQLVKLDENKFMLRIRERIERLKSHFSKTSTLEGADEQTLKDLWLIKKLVKKQRLPASICRSLEEFGVPLDSHVNDLNWLKHAKKVIDYFHRHGELPGRTVDSSLSTWCIKQRQTLRVSGLPDLSRLPNQEDVRKTREIIVEILKMEARPNWDRRLMELKDHIHQVGGFNAGTCGRELLRWVHKQRSFMNQGKLSAERERKLLEIGQVEWFSKANVWDKASLSMR